MTSKQLIQQIYLRVKKFRVLILGAAILMGVALFFYAKTLPGVWDTKATVFPLTSNNESNTTTSAISQLLGGGEAAKSISQEASISIVDIATSRNTREAVAMMRLPEFKNKCIAELLIENANKNKKFYTRTLEMPTDTILLAAVGGEILKQTFDAKPLKSGILEITYSNSNPDLLSPVTYAMIGKISQFYIDLKIKKAKQDYDFTLRKIDSLQEVLNGYDQRAITIANTTRFVPNNKIEYSIPKENLITKKQAALSQWQAVTNNREQALWRLQKATPIISILDKPERPFNLTKPSGLFYAIGGFILGLFLVTGLLIIPILYRYVEHETNKAIFGEEEKVPAADTVTTTTA
ncbi:MAG: hypothetical protein QM687_05100 [Ferruginibacter sp.]